MQHYNLACGVGNQFITHGGTACEEACCSNLKLRSANVAHLSPICCLCYRIYLYMVLTSRPYLGEGGVPPGSLLWCPEGFPCFKVRPIEI